MHCCCRPYNIDTHTHTRTWCTCIYLYIYIIYTLGVNVEVYLLRGQCYNVDVWVGETSTFPMLMFNPCEEIYGPWKRNEVQNHHTCICHANFPACRGPWNWIWNLQDPTGIEFPVYQGTLIYCQSSRAKHGTLNGLEICHCQKLMPQINVQRNRELGVATEGPDKPPKIFSVK